MQVLGVDVVPAKAEKERVIDVPAIDMTDAVPRVQAAKAKREPAARASRKATTAPPTRKTRAKAGRASGTEQAVSKDRPRRRRDGSVARETYDAVEALVSKGAKKGEAFAQVAKESGRSAGTVATTYYRVAGKQRPAAAAGRDAEASTPRKRTQKPRRQTTPGRRRVNSTGTRSGNDVEHLADQLVRSVGELVSAFKAQTDELEDLRGRMRGMRDVLD